MESCAYPAQWAAPGTVIPPDYMNRQGEAPCGALDHIQEGFIAQAEDSLVASHPGAGSSSEDEDSDERLARKGFPDGGHT